MANLNVSNRMAQVLGNQNAQQLVNKILSDGTVNKADKADLQELEAMLKAAAEEDGSLDGEEKELIGALTNHSYVLGVNTGTSEAILLDNLKKVQEIHQKFQGMQPSEVNFDGLAITTDGFFSDEVRVLRLRDQIMEEPGTPQHTETQPTTEAETPTETSQTTGQTAEQPQSTGTPTENTTQTTQTPSEPPAAGSSETGETTATSPVTTPPAEDTVEAIPPRAEYTPTSAPAATAPQTEVPEEVAPRVAAQEQAYTEAVQELQNEVLTVRNMLNDPNQVSNTQLQNSLQSFAESDPKRALQEIQRHNPDVLEDMKNAGLITDADMTTLKTTSSLSNQKLANGDMFRDVLSNYLADTPLTDSQLNGYRETLVNAADNYLADPSSENKATLRSELYDNLYVFEEGATPEQESAYRKLSPALDHADQKQAAFEEQLAVVTGESSVLNPTSGKGITSAEELAKTLNQLQTGPQSDIDHFANQMENVATYLEENPGQYEGQAADATALRNKVAELQNTPDAERKLALFNELKTDLDEIYIKTDIQKGAEGISQGEILGQLDQLSASTSNENTQQAIAFLKENPELLSSVPHVSEYKTILDSFNNGPTQLTPKQEELKAAMESGDTAKVNQMYMNEMFNNIGGFMGSFGSFFGLSSPTPETQEAPLPGTWMGASELAETLQQATPERRAELIQALQSPAVGQLAEAVQADPELAQIVGRYQNAQAAKTSIEQAHWSNNSGLEQTQQALQNQQNQPGAIQAELENAQQAIAQLLSKGDLAAPVEARLKAQQTSLNSAMEMIKAGTFTPEAAQQEGMAGVNEVLTAINNNDSQPPLSMEQAIQRQATLDTLAELKNDPETFQKLENVLGDLKDEEGNLLYGQMFEKDAEGNYKFPDQMASLLESDKLSTGGLEVAMHQINRSLHVIDSAKTRTEVTLRANLEQGKDLFEAGKGERDFYSGFMALQNMNAIAEAANSSAYLSPEDVINRVAVNAEGLNDTEMSVADRRAAISQIIQTSTEEAREAKLDNLDQNNLSSIMDSETLSGLDSLFTSEDETSVATRNRLLEQIQSIDENIDTSKIKSAQDIFTTLNANQVAELQNKLTQSTDGDVQAVRENLIEQLAQQGVQYTPNMSTVGQNSQATELINRLNNLNNQASNAARSSDSILQEAFGSSDMNAFVQAKQASTAFVQDMNTQISSLNQVMDSDIAQVPGLQQFLTGQNIPPRPTNPQSPNYHQEMAAYAEGVENATQAFLARPNPTPPLSNSDRARVGVVLQAATNTKVFSTVAFDVGSGGRIPPEHRQAARDAAATTHLITQASTQLAGAQSGQDALEIQGELQDKLTTYTTLAAQQDGIIDLPPGIDNPGDHLSLEDSTATGNAVMETLTVLDGNAQDFTAQGMSLATTPYEEIVESGGDLASFAPQVEVSSANVLQNAMTTAEIIIDIPPEEVIEIAQSVLQPSMQAQSQVWESFIESSDTYIEALNESRTELGMPPLETPINDTREAQQGSRASSGPTAAEQKAAQLVEEANALSKQLVLAPKGQDSEELLSDLINGFMNTIRDQDYKTRQLIMAQLANQMMTDSITHFYKDKTDKNNKYHQDSIERMADSFQRNIQRTIQESLVSSASDNQAIAAVSGQVGAANTAEAMGLEQLRVSTEQMINEAQKMDPPLITDLQKERLLSSLFDNDPNNDALGLIALAGIQNA